MSFRDAVLVFIGSGLGGVFRWSISVWTTKWLGVTRFPFSTFIANLIACILLAVIAGLSLREASPISLPVRLFLVTGFLGGLGTISAFGMETVALLRRGDYVVASANLILTLTVCLWVLHMILRATERL